MSYSASRNYNDIKHKLLHRYLHFGEAGVEYVDEQGHVLIGVTLEQLGVDRNKYKGRGRPRHTDYEYDLWLFFAVPIYGHAVYTSISLRDWNKWSAGTREDVIGYNCRMIVHNANE